MNPKSNSRRATVARATAGVAEALPGDKAAASSAAVTPAAIQTPNGRTRIPLPLPALPVLALILLLLLHLPVAVPAQTAAAPAIKPADALLLHGINPKTPDILAFFQNGFSEAALLRGLPVDPKEKTQVIIYAMRVLGDNRATEAVDVLSMICRRQFPKGVRQAMRLDMEGMDALVLATRRQELEQYLVFNGMVALGWIGDPKGAAVVRELMEAKSETGYITQGSLALAMMGEIGGLGELIDLMKTGTLAEATGAARSFYYITGRTYSMSLQTSVARRQAFVDDAKQWYASSGSDFEVTGAEVRRRRLGPYPPNPQAPDLATARGLCKASADVAGDYATSFKARQKLAELGPDSLPQLAEVARDLMEDNDVRLEAMRNYVTTAGKNAKSLLKELDDDDNKPVAERAQYILRNLEEYAARRLPTQ